jgi:hypothetical protein
LETLGKIASKTVGSRAELTLASIEVVATQTNVAGSRCSAESAASQVGGAELATVESGVQIVAGLALSADVGIIASETAV